VLGCPWQRCTVHFLRDCLGRARREEHGALAALIRPIFNQGGREEARDRLSEAVAALDGRLPKVCEALERAEEDILAFYAFPANHWRKLRSTNPLERLNREIGRRYLSAGSMAPLLEERGHREDEAEVKELQAA
jgi:putative transposase